MFLVIKVFSLICTSPIASSLLSLFDLTCSEGSGILPSSTPYFGHHQISLVLIILVNSVRSVSREESFAKMFFY